MTRPEGRLEQIDTICHHVVMNLIKDSSFCKFRYILEIVDRSIVFKNQIQTRLPQQGLARAHFQLSANVSDSRDRLMIFVRTGKST